MNAVNKIFLCKGVLKCVNNNFVVASNLITKRTIRGRVQYLDHHNVYGLVPENEKETTVSSIRKEEKQSVFEPPTEDVSLYAPYLKPSFNVAAYVDKSPTLQELVKLGVNFYEIEKKDGAVELLLKLDFDKDIKKYLIFLNDVGVNVDELGKFITKNPFILKEDIENLKVRINYLECKKFDKDMIMRIVTANPKWLMFSTHNIDYRLGYFQKTFKLKGDEVRHVATRQPKLITYDMNKIKRNTFSIKEEMGFTEEEMKNLLLKKPKLWMLNNKNIVERFVYANKTIDIPVEKICEQPEVLLCRLHKTKERHQFLKKLDRDQFDPTKPNYVSLMDLVSGSDAEFCEKVAKSSVLAFNMFIKTL